MADDVSVRVSGPILEHRTGPILARICRDVEKNVAQYALHEVQRELPTVLRHPTGYYESQVQLVGDDTVNDGGVIYGPWLEGTGSRNRSTRFKGYATFRRVAQRVDAKARELAEDVVAEHMEELR